MVTGGGATSYLLLKTLKQRCEFSRHSDYTITNIGTKLPQVLAGRLHSTKKNAPSEKMTFSKVGEAFPKEVVFHFRHGG